MGYALAIRGVVQVGSGRIQDGRWNASRKKAGYKRSSADHLSTSISYLIRGSKFRSNSRYHSGAVQMRSLVSYFLLSQKFIALSAIGSLSNWCYLQTYVFQVIVVIG